MDVQRHSFRGITRHASEETPKGSVGAGGGSLGVNEFEVLLSRRQVLQRATVLGVGGLVLSALPVKPWVSSMARERELL